MESLPLRDESDISIVMHRDSHFAGDFSLMIDYYREEGVGVQEEFALRRIEELAAVERKTGQNLAPLLLSGADAEKVGQARVMYQQLREIYEVEEGELLYPRLIADLILSEESDPVEEMRAIIAEGSAIVSSLLQLLDSREMHDPLFPGYGLAPKHALSCLGHIGDRRALLTLFERIGKGDFFDEEEAIASLRLMGTPAKHFLLNLVRASPPSDDSERAAIALLAFEGDSEVAATFSELLETVNYRQYPLLSSYLILGCVSLQSEEKRELFASLPDRRPMERALRADWEMVVKGWSR